MNDLLKISSGVSYDNSIVKKEFHSYSPFLNSYGNSDEIRISIQHQDLILLPCESFIYIEGAVYKSDDGTVSATAKLGNNAMAYLFDEIRYELNGVEIDRNRNAGFTSTIKNYISLHADESKMLLNAGWSPSAPITLQSGQFNFCIPLNMLLGFAEDYQKIIPNAKHELILVRARSDDNVLMSPTDTVTVKILKLKWKIPHITLADEEKLTLYKLIENNQPIKMSFRSWDMYEYPVLPETSQHTWTVKTSNQLEKPRYVILALQTDRRNQKGKDASNFDHCKLTDIKVHLNSISFPYDDLDLKFDQDRFALLYDMYCKFQSAYYTRKEQPLLSPNEFKNNAPIIVIDCAHQNESIKSGPVDVRLEFKLSGNIPANTSAFCLLLHDQIVEHRPLTNEVRKVPQ